MPEDVHLKDVGEFGLISRLTAGAKQGCGVVTGIGDDAAVCALTPGMQLLTSTDMLLEDVHFRLSWHDPYRLGRKSLAVNISDIASMGAIPRWTLLSLAIPAGLPLEFLDQFSAGFLAMAEEQGVSLIGGDTCSSRDRLALSVTIMGEQYPEQILRRSGACPGDEIWVTGTLGDAALGLQILENKYPAPGVEQCCAGEKTALITRLLDPEPRVAAGLALAASGLVSAMIDVSDGILSDFGHIAEMSRVGGTIRFDCLPRSADFLEIMQPPSAFNPQLALSGGEDYELCFTAPPAHREKIIDLMKKCGVQVTPVGIVTSSHEVTVVKADGSRYNPAHCGFNHFS